MAAAALLCSALGCGDHQPSPTAPTTPTGSGPVTNVRVVSMLGDQPVIGASAIGTVRSTSSDAGGLMTIEAATAGRYSVRVSAAQFVTRTTAINVPGGDARLDLIPSSFDLVSFDQMFRGVTTGNRVAKWIAAPVLIVQRSGLLWANSPDERYLAEDERWTDAEVDGVIADLAFGLQTISAGVFPSFSAIRVEQAAAGTMVPVAQTGAIVVARYRALRGPSGDRIGGLGTTNIDAAGVIRGGILKVDRESELNSPSTTRRLRVHELGHTMGLSHVTSRASFMNTPTTTLPNDADIEASRVAARRSPGNRSPDVDPADFILNPVASAITRRH